MRGHGRSDERNHHVDHEQNARRPGLCRPAARVRPYGHPTGLCSGIAATAYQDEALSLQPCTTPDTTVWILDFKDSQLKGDYSIINASTTDFTHPFVMTISGNPAQQPYTPIIMQHLTGNPGNVPANQLWATAAGPL